MGNINQLSRIMERFLEIITVVLMVSLTAGGALCGGDPLCMENTLLV